MVCAWIGNSARVAAKHYLQVREEDFDRAANGAAKSDAKALQNPVQQPVADVSKDSQTISEAFENKRVMLVDARLAGSVLENVLLRACNLQLQAQIFTIIMI